MNKQEQKKEETQLNLGLKNNLFNNFFKLRGRFQLKLAYFETKKFVRSPITWIYIVLTTLFLTVQGYIIQQLFDRLPTQIPLFTYLLDSSKKLISKDYILIIPGITLFTMILSIHFANKYYHQEKYMSSFIMTSMLSLSILLTILLFRIIAPYYG